MVSGWSALSVPMAVVTVEILEGRRVMNLDITDEETAALLQELDGLIDGDRYFMSQRIKTLNAIRAKIRPEPGASRCLRRRSNMRHRGRRSS
jgi:hypothetical protein